MFILNLSVTKNGASCYNILHISPCASPSHHLWNRQLSLALVERGHNVTMLTHDKEKRPLPKNWTLIIYEGVYKELHEECDYVAMAEEALKQRYSEAMMVYNWQAHVSRIGINHAAIDTLLNYPEDYKFDLIIYDITTTQHLYPLIDRFNRPPVIAVTPFMLPQYMVKLMGGHVLPSYSPHFITKFTNKMSFVQRFHNFIYSYVDMFGRKYRHMKAEEAYARGRFDKKYVRPLPEYEQEFAILLCNYDPIVDYSLSLPPNIIPVGGLHARPGKALPADLQKVFDNAKDGVILFSLGTNIKSSSLNLDLQKRILGALSKLKQTVIWKFEEDIEGLPKNVIARKWLPQNDMMANPKLKLFISHGGALSTQESMYHGVPIVGIPFLADQMFNLQRLQERKLGRYLLFSDLTETNFYEIISDVIYNPIYSNNAKRLSGMIRDRPQTPLETAVYWVERIGKYGRIVELRIPASTMCVTQIYNLDILALFALILVVFIICLKKLLKSCSTSKKVAKKHKIS